jgi:putative serine protease PepD
MVCAMNEHETDPQRHETPGQEPSHRPADASFESSSRERGESEPTAAQPTVGQPAIQPPAAQPASPWQPQAPFAQPLHPGYPPDPGYGGQQPAFAAGYAHPQQASGYAGPTGYPPGDQPGYPQTPQDGHPAWAAPVVTGTGPGRTGRGRRIFVAGADRRRSAGQCRLDHHRLR